MPRTAPTYTGTPTYQVVSYRFVDANGQLGSVPITTTPARATVANVEAMAVALGAASNANLYDIVIEAHTESTFGIDVSAAIEEPRESVKDIINILEKNTSTRQTQDIEIPAPLDSVFVAGSNDVVTDNVLIVAVINAAEALLPVEYVAQSVRFTERKGRNKATRL